MGEIIGDYCNHNYNLGAINNIQYVEQYAAQLIYSSGGLIDTIQQVIVVAARGTILRVLYCMVLIVITNRTRQMRLKELNWGCLPQAQPAQVNIVKICHIFGYVVTRQYLVMSYIIQSGPKVSLHTLGLIAPPCFIFEGCCFADSILYLLVRGFRRQNLKIRIS